MYPLKIFQATLSLLERVLMKDVVTPVAPEEVRTMIQTSLENAALLNYTTLSQKANIEGKITITIILILNGRQKRPKKLRKLSLSNISCWVAKLHVAGQIKKQITSICFGSSEFAEYVK